MAEAAGSSCLTMTMPGVEHVQAYERDPEGYVTTVGAVFHRVISVLEKRRRSAQVHFVRAGATKKADVQTPNVWPAF